MAIELLFGIGISAFLIIYFAMRLDDKEHTAFRFILVGFFFLLLMLVGKATVDYSDNCIQFVENATIDGNTTFYEYDYNCTATENSTATIFFKLVNSLFYIFLIYTVIYVIYFILKKYEKLPKVFKKFQK